MTLGALTSHAHGRNATVLVLGVVTLLGGQAPGCGGGRRDREGGSTPAASPATAVTSLGPSLSALLERLPEDVDWAVVTRGFGSPAARVEEAFALLREHPALSTQLRSMKTRLVERVGVWPFDPAGLSALGLGAESALAVYRRPPGSDGRPVIGLVVLGMRPRTLAKAISSALRQRGLAMEDQLRTHRVGGRLLLSFQERWTCAYEQGAARCAEVARDSWAEQVFSPGRNLRTGPLGALSDGDLTGDLGLYLARLPRRWPTLVRALLGERPDRLWGAMSLGGLPRIRAILVGAPGQGRPGSRPTAPGPTRVPAGPTGLAAAMGAEAVLRLKLAPGELLGLLGALGPGGRAAVELLGPKGPKGPTALVTTLQGELLLVSFADGLGAIARLRDPAAARRALAALEVLLSARLPSWQRQIRERGPGWDLAMETLPSVGRGVRGLLLQLPTGRRAPFPALRTGQLRLVWGISDEHLVVATDPILFGRLQGRASLPDAEFIGQAASADRRQAFAPTAQVSLALKVDDPLALMPAPQRDLLRRHLDAFGPHARRWLAIIGAAGDIFHELTLSARPHQAGTLVEAWVGLPITGARTGQDGPGSARLATKGRPAEPLVMPWISPSWSEALGRKWGRNQAGYAETLRTFSREDQASWLREKARRNLPSTDAVPHVGLTGLVAGVLIPLAAAERSARWPEEARTRLARLGELLRRRAAEDSHLPSPARTRWHRALESTRLTPAARCCDSADRLCQSGPRDWWHPTWKALGFALHEQHRYRYAVKVKRGSVRSHIVFSAEADLSCDGRRSRLALPAEVDERTGALTLGSIRVLEPGTRRVP